MKDPEQTNPFHPFAPISRALAGNIQIRPDLIRTVLELLANPDFPVAVLSGGSGIGKSTIVRSALPAVLEQSGRVVVLLTGAPSLTVTQIATDVAISLGLTDRRYTKKYENSNSVTQSAGAVEDSQDVGVSQSAASVHVTGDDNFDGSDLAAWLDAIIVATSRPITAVLDQVEQLFVPGGRTSAIRLLEQLLRAALVCEGRVGLVLAVRDRYIHEVIHLGANYHGLVSRIVPVYGLERADASSVIRSGTDLYGVRFSASLVDRLITRLQGDDGRIWPVALHASCRPLAEIARQRSRAATIHDLRTLGDLSGVLANAVSNELMTLSSDGKGDALFILSTVASLHQTEGPVSLENLARTIPSYPLTELEPIIDALIGLKLLERDRAGNYRPSHDSIGGAVSMLRSPEGVSAAVRRLDESVTRWSRDGYVSRIDDVPIGTLLRTITQPTPHLIFLSTVLLMDPSDQDAYRLLRDLLARATPQHLIKLVWAQARRTGRRRSLGPDGVFALAMAGNTDCMMSALDGLRLAARGPDVRWLPAEYLLALDRAHARLNGDLLRQCRLSEWPTAAARIVIRTCLRQVDLDLNHDVFRSLWTDLAVVLQTDLLQLVARHGREFAGEFIDEAMRSDRDYVRAAALEAAVTLPGANAASLITAAVADSSTMVRRRATYLLDRLDVETAAPMLEDLAISDSSSFVREAAMEIIGGLAMPLFEAVTRSALSDDAPIVRESATYAMRHTIGAERAAEAVAALIHDDSANVREAALRVLSLANRPPNPETIVANLRSGSESLRTAALEALRMSGADYTLPLLPEMLTDAPKPTTIGVLRVLATGRSESPLAELSRLVFTAQDAEVLCEAALTLQAIGGADASELLCSLVFHPSTDVRERAVYALAEVGGPDAGNVLMSCVYDPNTAIQVRAIYGLARLRFVGAREIIRLINPASAELNEAVQYYLREVSS